MWLCGYADMRVLFGGKEKATITISRCLNCRRRRREEATGTEWSMELLRSYANSPELWRLEGGREAD